MDKRYMSQNKYVYEVYLAYGAFEMEIHMEKHPVVYSNSKYVYIKRGRKDALERLDTSDIYEEISVDACNKILDKEVHTYFWGIDDDKQKHLTNFKALKTERDRRKQIDSVKLAYRMAKESFERAKKYYDELPDEEKQI